MFLAACVVCALAFQGTRGIWDPDEGRYAEATRGMLAAGDWIAPVLDGRAHLTKPPGAYWATALGMLLLGHGEWGARLFLGLAFGASAWCVRRAGRAILGGPAGARAGWCYLGMLYPFAAGSLLSTDTFLAAGLAATYACSAAALAAERPGRWLAGAGVALGAAVFTKGHVALLGWGAFVVGFAVAGRRAFPGRRIASVPGVLVALVPIALWLLAVHLRVEGGLERVIREARLHVEGEGDHGDKAWWFYPAIVVGGVAPWWAQVAGGMRRLRFGPVGVWLTVWAGAVLLVQWAVPTKMPLYLLPMAVPLALWAGAREPRDAASPLPWPRTALALWLVALCGLRVAPLLLDDRRDMRPPADAVLAADPDGRMQWALLGGRDFQGVRYYLDARPVRLRTKEVGNIRAVAELEDFDAAAHEPWLLLAEEGRSEDRALARALGARSAEVARGTGWRLLRIEPRRP